MEKIKQNKMKTGKNTQNHKTDKNYRFIMMRSRKAVSPLIATVLLIAFAVALGAVVMNWGRGYVEDTANMARERSDAEVTCTAEVELQAVEIDNTPQVCWNYSGSTGYIFLILENPKEKNIENMELRLIGTDTRVPLTITNFSSETLTDYYTSDTIKLGENEAQFMQVNYSYSTYGEPVQVKVTPYIKAGCNLVSCSSNAAIFTNMKTCAIVWD
jgi:flagellin-like protein